MIKLHDRIKETSQTVGTGDMFLQGTTPGFDTFSSFFSDQDTFFYAISSPNGYEIGYGTYNSGPNSITRTEVFKSSNTDSKVSWTQGVKEVYVTYPADKSVYQPYDSNGVSGELSFWEDSNTLGSASGTLWDGENLSLPNDLSVTEAISGVEFIIEDSISFDGYPTSQTKPFLSNTLVESTEIGRVLELSGEVNQNIGLKQQPRNNVFAGPINICGDTPCVADYPRFRPLQADDIPAISAEHVLYAPIDTNDWIINPTNVQQGFDYLASTITNIEDLFPDSLPADGGNADTLDNLDSTDFALVNHIHEDLVFATIVETNKEFNDATKSIDSPEQIFNDWSRFSHNDTGQDANTSEENSFTYDEPSQTINSTVNSTAYIGFISPVAYSNFSFELLIKSTGSDNDVVGVVVGFYVDGEGKEHTLTLYISRSNQDITMPFMPDPLSSKIQTYGFVYNYRRDDQVFYEGGEHLGYGNWNENNAEDGIKLKIERDGDMIRAYRSDFNNTSLKTAEGEYLELNLNNYPELFKFKGRQKYGISTYSQPGVSFSDMVFTNNDAVIYNLVDGKTYISENDVWVESNTLDFSNLEENTFVYNEQTEKLFYVKNQNTISNVSSKLDKIRVQDNGIEIANWEYLNEVVSLETYYYERRNGAVKLNTDGMVGISIEDRALPYGEPGDIGSSSDELETNGLELNGYLPRQMYAVRRDGDDIYMDVNTGGEVKSLNLGTVT